MQPGTQLKNAFGKLKAKGDRGMETGFLILGLTGALGSGCSTIAQFLSSDLEQYKSEVKQSIRENQVQINTFFRYIKSERDAINKSHSNTSDNDSPQKLFENHVKNKEFDDKESFLKTLNGELIDKLAKRKIFNKYVSNDWPHFTKISMSTLILMKVVELALNEDGEKESLEFEHYIKSCNQSDNSAFSPNARELIINCAKNINIKLREFKDIIHRRRFDLLDSAKCKEIDGVIIELLKIKNELSSNEYVGPEWFQDMGDNIRGSGNPFISKTDNDPVNLDLLSREANTLIKYHRRRKDNKCSSYFVIDSFRNPSEVSFFRKRYGSFYLCSLFSNAIARKSRLKNKYFEHKEKRDQGKYSTATDLHKQNVPGCTLIADFAINSDKYFGCDVKTQDINSIESQNQKHARYSIIKLLTLIESPGLVPPTPDEVNMNFAYSMSTRSLCLSRQVGAIITNSDGFVVAAGWNDVGIGQIGCSMMSINDFRRYMDDDGLLSNWSDVFSDFDRNNLLADFDPDNSFCFKDLQSEVHLSKKIAKSERKTFDEETIPCSECKSLFSKRDKSLHIKRLEYARSLHAEENALLQAARFGGVGVEGGTIYTTTYPCELCSKKIYQAQLRRIVYTEPYPESLSETIFLRDGVRNIVIDQFEGVKSVSFHRLFKSPFDIKESQQIQQARTKGATNS
jgi:Deoxycytidylate deaminase